MALNELISLDEVSLKLSVFAAKTWNFAAWFFHQA